MKAHREKVLVLGDGVSAFLAVIRSLGRKGIEVHAAWCRPDCPALWSRYVERFHALPFCDEEGLWVEQLTRLLRQEHFDLVLPTNEQTTRALYFRRSEFERHARLYLMDEPAFRVVFDKVKSGQLAESLGLRVPRTKIVSTADELDGLESEFKFPIVLKPVSTYDPHAPMERRNVAKAYDRDELLRHARRMLGEGSIAVQENFLGRGVGVELLVDRGRVLLAFQHERVHQPLRGGASSYRKSVPLRRDLLEAARKYVAALEYSGVIMIEFLASESDEDWRFVEANGRFWGSLPLAVAAGADFPHALYRYLVHNQRQFPAEYRQGLYCRDLLSDAQWFLRNLRADRRDPTLATLSPWRVLLEIRHVLALQERYDTLTLDDPLPAVVEPVNYARRVLARVGRRVRQLAVSLPGIRHWQASRTRSAVGRARRVAFVCWGNICRSPFAAEYARRSWPEGIEVLSRGLHYPRNRRSPRDAVEAARRFEVELDAHRSSVISQADIEAVDVILCFDEEIRSELCARHPCARSKTFRFGMLRSAGRVGVVDPFGRPFSRFCEAYEQIKATLDESRGVFRAAPPAAAASVSNQQAAPTR
jgi:protein-tyrosine-phosphatase/predicted ATP-grasp superfamily ATP-dependent carboligase